jgi:hypothetical protein
MRYQRTGDRLWLSSITSTARARVATRKARRSDPVQEFGATRSDPVDDQFEPSSLPEAVGPLAIASPEEEAEAVDDTQVEEQANADRPDAESEAASRLDTDPARIAAATRR